LTQLAPSVRSVRSPARRRQDPILLILSVTCLALLGLAVAGPFFAPFPADRTDILAAGLDPNAQHLLGTDALGRDILSRLLVGARLSFAAFADPLDDSEMRSTIMLNAWEENRHKEVLSHLVCAYGIELAEEPPYLPPRDREFAFLVTGYSESIDSFFAFGLFELAKRSGFFPAELVETFELDAEWTEEFDNSATSSGDVSGHIPRVTRGHPSDHFRPKYRSLC